MVDIFLKTPSFDQSYHTQHYLPASVIDDANHICD